MSAPIIPTMQPVSVSTPADISTLPNFTVPQGSFSTAPVQPQGLSAQGSPVQPQQSININTGSTSSHIPGQPQPVNTAQGQPIPAPGKSSTKKGKASPGAVVGGAAAGALTGALFLGPVGAAVGGVAGAGIGAAASRKKN